MADDGSTLYDVAADDLVHDVASGPKSGWDRHYTVDVVAQDDAMASAVVHSDPFTEYLHLARLDDGWQIVNAFYRWNRPPPGQ